METDTKTSKLNFYRTEYCHKFLFPYHLYKVTSTAHNNQSCHKTRKSTLLTFFQNITFSKVRAAEDVSKTDNNSPVNNEPIPTELLESIARAYVDRETGMERIYMLFRKNHKGEQSTELHMIKFALIQTLFISFFIKYVPEWKLAKEDFIREHRGTVFRTRIEALRLMQDQVSLRAIKAGATFSIKATSFSSLFLMISQMIATYRNKSSVLEYSLAAGLTGGLYRLNLGLKAFISGTIVGATLGSLAGCIGWVLLHALNMKQDQRHLLEIMSRMEVERYLIGEDAFKAKLEEVKRNALSSTLPVSHT